MTPLAQPHPNALAQQLTGRSYLSFSAMDTYRQCPLRYYFRYVAGLPAELVSSSLAFGGAIHAAIEHHYNELMAGDAAPLPARLVEVFWDAWRCTSEEAVIQFGKGEDLQSVQELAQRVLAAFRTSQLAQPEGRLLGVEEELRGCLIPGVPDLLARIDLLIETDHELIVRDFKTSRGRWSDGQAEGQGEQLLLYSELARQLAPDKSLRLEFVVIGKTKEPTIERHRVLPDPQQVSRTKRTFEQVWRAIEARFFYPAPSPLHCPGCPFRDPCRAWGGWPGRGHFDPHTSRETHDPNESR